MMKQKEKGHSEPNQRRSAPRVLRDTRVNYIKVGVSVLIAWAILAAVAAFALNRVPQYEDHVADVEMTLKALDARVEALEQSQVATEAVDAQAEQAKKPLKAKKPDEAKPKSPKTAKTVVSKPKKSNEAGKYKITFYCPCEKCCGKWAGGKTASGTKPTANRTVAAPKSFAFGTQIRIEGLGHFVVEDRGGAIKGNRLDVFVDSHAEALRLGVMHKEVSIVYD